MGRASSVEDRIKKGEIAPGVIAFLEKERETARLRPSKIVTSAMEIGAFIGNVRRGLNIRQVDLADRAHIGRQWLIALEQGKQTLEIEPVMRTLMTLGFELELKPYTPIPTWIETAMREAEFRKRFAKRERNTRRCSRRAAERARRLAENAPRVAVDLE